ncbi:M24 family metallopeptidase [Geminicoccaceae bacterium 1502E]|nr:M24 family metallopeptidase [Geminicoccaceae bacterium 1502E]
MTAALADLLRQAGSPLSFDEADALLAGIAAAPEPPQAEAWLALFGGQPSQALRAALIARRDALLGEAAAREARSPALPERLRLLRVELRRQGVDGFFLPRTDEHGSEYLPLAAERVAWLTGFTGSAGQVVVLADKAAVFSDGRYTVQLDEQVDPASFERCRLAEVTPAGWLERNLPEGAALGFDPFLVTARERTALERVVAARGGRLVALERNPVDDVWTARPAAPVAPLQLHEERFGGESSAARRERIGGEIAAKGADWLLLTGADSIAWLLNVRGSDIPFNPLTLGFALLHRDGTCRFFLDPRKVPPGTSLGNAVALEPVAGFPAALDALGREGARVLADPGEAHVGFVDRLRTAGAAVVEAENPCLLAKACKNPVEVAGAVAAQRRDGAAMVRFLAWLDAQPVDGAVDEVSAADRLEAERAKDPLFRGLSFPTISAHGPNAALPHYRTTPETRRRLAGGTVYLVDSGGQYLDATTDITRTVARGEASEEIRERFTLVLKGHIAVATAVFPEGTSGAQLDTLARIALWRHGLDFDHGTGHGVGSYLCVHEGPQRISKVSQTPLRPGMILSNEPGFYRPGAYGIRIENLLVVEPRATPEGGDRKLLGFRNLTLCPIDRRLVEPSLLSAEERAWLDGYHAIVLEELMPLLHEESDRAWLRTACARLHD